MLLFGLEELWLLSFRFWADKGEVWVLGYGGGFIRIGIASGGVNP